MAGDWIPMRIDLFEDPAVIQMAERMKVREEVVVGYLHKVWSWVSRQCHADVTLMSHDSCVSATVSVTLASLGRVVHLPGFPEEMAAVGWLEAVEGGIRIPHFDRWLSQSAKSRVLAANRKRQQRDKQRHGPVTQKSRNERDRNGTTEEKRREEKSKESTKESRVVPTAVEVAMYCTDRGCVIDPDEFCDYYAAQGWKLANGRAMKDWRACVRRWVRNHQDRSQATGQEMPHI